MPFAGFTRGPVPVPGNAPDPGALFASLSASPDPVFVTDRHNRVVFLNTSAQNILGFAPEEVVGETCFAALEGGDRYGNRYCSENCPIAQIANRGEIVQPFELRLRARDGHLVDVQITVLNLSVAPPDLFFLVHIFRLPAPASTQTHDASRDGELSPPTALASRSSVDARARRLTSREVEVLAMLAAGRTTPEIAERLHISVLTARNHVQNILDKLEVHSKAEAVAFAFQKHLIP